MSNEGILKRGKWVGKLIREIKAINNDNFSKEQCPLISCK